MIDINELRQSAQAATPGPWYIGSGTYEGRNIYSVEAVTDDEGFTYNPVVATAEDDDVVCWEANARLIAAANPAVISELLDRLEAAEKDIAIKEEVIDSLATVIKRLDAQCDAAEKERNTLRTTVRHESDCVEAAKAEIKALRAKIEAMEKQVPICRAEDLRHAEILLPSLGLMPEDKLYALPDAKTAPSVPKGWKLVPIEPTSEMVKACVSAARAYMQEYGGNSPQVMWDAMLAAAPEAKP